MLVTVILSRCLLHSFLKNLEHISFITRFHLSLFLLSRTDILVLTWLCVCSPYWSFSCIIHVISHYCLFLFYLYPTVSENKWSSSWCSTFTGTLNQPLFTDFLIIISFSSHFGFSSSHMILGVIIIIVTSYDNLRQRSQSIISNQSLAPRGRVAVVSIVSVGALAAILSSANEFYDDS
jgi:hypothetical protein